MLEFTQIMEQLINSGLSIKDALEISSLINKKNDNLETKIYKQIQKGIPFAEVVNQMSNVFSPVYRGIISVGDRIGSVEKIFPRLRLYLETQKKIKDKLLGALIYPIIVLVTTLLVFTAMIFFVFPKLKTMFLEFGGEASQLLETKISHMETGFITIFIVFLFLIFLSLIFRILISRNNSIKTTKDTFLLKVPAVGRFLSYLESLHFSFAMETLLSGGITIEDSISESLSVISNNAYKEALKDIRNRITRGESISQAFSMHENIFPDYMIKWMMVGEKSGKPEQVFSQLRNYFQNEIDLYTTKFMTLIEPALIILIGIFLVTLILNVIVPVFSLYGSIL